MKKLVIDRSTWVRGNPLDAALLNEEGKRCCLGFYLRACGVADEHMQSIGDPQTMVTKTGTRVPEAAAWLVRETPDSAVPHQHSDACNDLIHDNDGGFYDESMREKAIAAKFADHGVEVVFVDTASEQSGTEGGSHDD